MQTPVTPRPSGWNFSKYFACNLSNKRDSVRDRCVCVSINLGSLKDGNM